MSRGTLWAGLALAMIFGLTSCGGGEEKSKRTKTVSWKKISHFGVTMKIPKIFKKNPAGGSDSVQYMYKGGMAIILIEKTDGYEEGLEKYMAEQYEKRQRKTQKRFKSKDAYKILKKDTELTMGGKKAFEIEHEYRDQSGDVTAHSLDIIVDLGEKKVLAIIWKVSDVEESPWDRFFNRYFKESRASVNMR